MWKKRRHKETPPTSNFLKRVEPKSPCQTYEIVATIDETKGTILLTGMKLCSNRANGIIMMLAGDGMIASYDEAGLTVKYNRPHSGVDVARSAVATILPMLGVAKFTIENSKKPAVAVAT